MSKTILIVDDNKNLGKLIQDWLEIVFPDCTIAAVLSSADALEYFTKEIPEIVIMDINLDGINGIEATRQLKNKYPLTKIIFLSIFNDDFHRCAAFSAGASGYVVKSKINSEFIPLLKMLINSEVSASAPMTP